MNNFWEKKGGDKQFSHPIQDIFYDFAPIDSLVLDYGCGNGRVIDILHSYGFNDFIALDSSRKMLESAKSNVNKDDDINVFYFDKLSEIDKEFDDGAVDVAMLFAVLTCNIQEKDQFEIISYCKRKLREGGIIYISDYLLQDSSAYNQRYKSHYLDNACVYPYGVFDTSNNETKMRHLLYNNLFLMLSDFTVLKESKFSIKTMNGNDAECFQVILRK